MRKRISWKGLDDDLEGLDIEVELDRERKVVTLHMLEFEAEHVTSFLVDSLPWDFMVRVDDSLFEHVLNLPRYELVIALAGRHHPVTFQYPDGRMTIRLGDPNGAYLAKCEQAIAQILSALHSRDIEGVVAGVARYGRPEPNEGFLHLLARAQGEAQEEDVLKLCNEADVLAHEAHFAWDPETRRVVRRNWSPT
jgi:hypothetical protein